MPVNLATSEAEIGKMEEQGQPCTANEMVTKLKRHLTEWEKIFATYICDKGLITRIFRKLQKLYSQRIHDPVKKCEVK
jgi:hypothetical protein